MKNQFSFLQYLVSTLSNERGEAEIQDPPVKEGEEQDPPPGAKQEPTLEERLAAMESKYDEAEREKKGIYDDLKSERERRRELEQKMAQNEQKIREQDEQDPLSGLGDEDFITAKQLKQLQAAHSLRERKRIMADLQGRAAERMASDESRLIELCDLNPKKFPVPYEEAIKEFESLAKKDPSLWDEIDRQKFKPGGKPAEAAYRIALRESSKFLQEKERRTREALLDEIENHEDKPRRLRSGSGGAARRLDQMSDQEIMGLSDDDLDKALRST